MASKPPIQPLQSAPKYAELPDARLRAARAGPELAEIDVRLEVVTPILGGGYQPRMLDDVDVIRATSIRGHLRTWWRALALHSPEYRSAEELYASESAMWGRAATDKGGRSAVEIRVDVEHVGDTDDSNVGPATPGAYAMWPARAETATQTPAAHRRRPGTRFMLRLKFDATLETEVKNVLRAWILFGGYGGRTRRGLGSLNVLDDANVWLPASATREAFRKLFNFDLFAPVANAPCDVPCFGGASIHVRTAVPNAQTAWTTALDWLREFRQGTSGTASNRAREPSSDPNRPSISNWPEGDKVRQLSTPVPGLRWAHTPRHNSAAAWPRAGFGLPIIGQFQSKSREDHPTRKRRNGRPDQKYWNELSAAHPNYGTEPSNFELRWRAGNDEHDRLASPLIVKALPLADGSFAPCALWMNRAYPVNGEVILRDVSGSQAPFDCLVASSDTACFSTLAKNPSLRDAFLGWLLREKRTTVVAP